MAKLKLGAIADEKPVKLTVELPAAVHRDLLAYADYLNSQHVSVALTEKVSRLAGHSSNVLNDGLVRDAHHPP